MKLIRDIKRKIKMAICGHLHSSDIDWKNEMLVKVSNSYDHKGNICRTVKYTVYDNSGVSRWLIEDTDDKNNSHMFDIKDMIKEIKPEWKIVENTVIDNSDEADYCDDSPVEYNARVMFRELPLQDASADEINDLMLKELSLVKSAIISDIKVVHEVDSILGREKYVDVKCECQDDYNTVIGIAKRYSDYYERTRQYRK